MTTLRRFILKVNANECPNEIGRPHDPSEWEGKIFKADNPRKAKGRVKLAPQQARNPDPGDHLLIWVNDGDGKGAGLTASGETVVFDSDSREVTIKSLKLFPTPRLNGSDLRNPNHHPALKDIADSRVSALRYVPLEHWQAICGAATEKVAMAVRFYANVTAEEGKRVYFRSVKLERDPKISKEVKERNKQLHDGVYKCEACTFSEDKPALFDAHHLVPLCLGQRQTSIYHDFAVLCPTCHRLAHRLGALHDPLSISQIKKWWQARGPGAPSEKAER